MKQRLKDNIRKYLRVLAIIPIFLIALVASFFIVLRIPPELWGCEGFGCIGLIFLLPYMAVVLALPIAMAIYLVIMSNSKFTLGLKASIKNFILKPFPKKKIILLISSIPLLLLLLLISTSFLNKKYVSKYQVQRPTYPTPTTVQNQITQANPTVAVANIKQDQINWRSYTNSDLGFKLQYPESYYLQEDTYNLNPIVKISDDINFENEETALIISIQEAENYNFTGSENQELKKVMNKIGYQQISERFAYHTSYNFIGDPPWGYYQISIPSMQVDKPTLLLTVRLHRQDDMQMSEGDTQGAKAEMVKQILSTFKFTN